MNPKQADITKRDGAMRALHEKGWTLKQIGQEYGLSRQRVHQILDKKYGLRRSKLSTMALRNA